MSTPYLIPYAVEVFDPGAGWTIYTEAADLAEGWRQFTHGNVRYPYFSLRLVENGTETILRQFAGNFHEWWLSRGHLSLD